MLKTDADRPASSGDFSWPWSRQLLWSTCTSKTGQSSISVGATDINLAVSVVAH
jgi:hypothetical protein